MTSDSNTTHVSTTDRFSTGITAADSILNGGLLPGRSTLVRGPPGSSKTLFGVHFLTQGVENGDTCLFINLGEPEEFLRQDIASFGLDFDDGFECAPQLVPEHHEQEFPAETIRSGVPELDELLHGGIDRGTVTFLSGPTGVGKTTIGLQFMKEAAGRGENSILYSFEEGTDTLLHRAEAVNIPVKSMLDKGTLRIEEIQPFELTANEFGQRVRHAVEDDEAEIVMIDSIGGYRKSVRGVSEGSNHEIAALGRYLKNMGVTTILPNEVHQITGEFQVTESGTSYLADNIVFLRHIEHQGELRKVIGVLKKRTSDYEKRLRELSITEHGLKIGDPLPKLSGILTGTPEFVDPAVPSFPDTEQDSGGALNE